MGLRTALYTEHQEAGARIVDFGGWDMPLHYGSQVEEHHCVRRDAGMFDVSHMTVVDVSGPGAESYLARLLANNVGRLAESGKALYSCMLNTRGGVVDDLIVYRTGDSGFRLVVNAATREKDLRWMAKQKSEFDATLEERPDLAMIAVQGPRAREKLLGTMPGGARAGLEALAVFAAASCGDMFVARTGYTGEDGFEIMLPGREARDLWRSLLGAGVAPAGLGARDTLRLEAGMCLYGTDMDEDITPLESGLGWTVAWTPSDRQFVGREALESQKAQGAGRRLAGLVLEQGRGVLRNHQKVVTEAGEGEITSGSFSPTLGVSIALARVPSATGSECQVEVRGKLLPVRVVKPPFVRQGESCLA